MITDSIQKHNSTLTFFPITKDDIKQALPVPPYITTCLGKLFHKTCSVRVSDQARPLHVLKSKVTNYLKNQQISLNKNKKIGSIFAEAVYLNSLLNKIQNNEHTLTKEDLDILQSRDLGIKVKEFPPSHIQSSIGFFLQYQLETTKPLTGMTLRFTEKYQNLTGIAQVLLDLKEKINHDIRDDLSTKASEPKATSSLEKVEEKQEEPKVASVLKRKIRRPYEFNENRHELRSKSARYELRSKSARKA